MSVLVILIATIGLGVATVSVFVIRRVANRPANGELKTLAALDRKIISNQENIIRIFRTCKAETVRI